MAHRSSLPKYRKGEVVFCLNKEEKMWPGRIETIGEKYEVKHFRVKQTVWVDAKKLEKFTEEAKQAYQQKGKQYLNALKAAEKVHEQNQEEKIIDVSVEPKLQEDQSIDKSQLNKLDCKEQEESVHNQDQDQEENTGFIATLMKFGKEELIQSVKIGRWISLPVPNENQRKNVQFPAKQVYIQFIHALLSSLFYSRSSKSLYSTIIYLLKNCPLDPCEILTENITLSVNAFINSKPGHFPSKSEDQFIMQLKKWRKELEAKVEQKLQEDNIWDALLEENNKLNAILNLC